MGAISVALSFFLVFSYSFCQMPRLAVSADIGTQIFRRGIRGNLVRGRGQGLAFGVVLSFARYRAF